MEAPAGAGQILLSDETKHGLAADFAPVHTASFHPWPNRRLKGYSGGHTLWDVLYDGRVAQEPGAAWVPLWYRGVLDTFIARPEWVKKILDWETNQTETFFVLLGMGGLGKTRLALETGMALLTRFTDGVEFVRLDDATLPKPITVDAFARELGRQLRLSERAPEVANDPQNLLAGWLESKNLFLVLDNWESVDDTACAAWLEKTLVQSGTRCLVTTRKQWPGTLRQVTYDLEALEVAPTPADAPQCAAGQLFLARITKKSFVLQPRELPHFHKLLTLTHGLPLAIELLAARATDRLGEFVRFAKEVEAQRVAQLTLTPHLTRVDKERYQSIAKCVLWSVERLPEEQQSVLPRLSVFPQDFGRDTLEEVCQIPSDWVDEWTRASLLERTGAGRFVLHALIRDVLSQSLSVDDKTKYEAALMQRAVRWVDENGDLNGTGNVEIMDAEWPTLVALHQRAIEQKAHDTAYNLTRPYQYTVSRALAAVYLEQVRKTIAITPETEEWTHVALQNDLGLAYSDLPSGDRDSNLRAAIACYEAALRVYTEDRFPMQWAGTQNNLGNAYGQLPSGDRDANLRSAIAYFESALHVRTEDHFPMDWAMTQKNLGNAYSELPTGDRDANLRSAIACYESALRVYTKDRFSMDWAGTQNNLGLAYSELPSGDRATNLRVAVSCYESALRVYTKERFPMDWAMTQNNLGLAYSELSTGDRHANRRSAISCYESSLHIYTEERFPMYWAGTQNNLGLVYSELLTGDRDANLRVAVSCYESALRVYTKERFPMNWATTQANIGLLAGQQEKFQEALVRLRSARRVFEYIGHTHYVERIDSQIEQMEASLGSLGLATPSGSTKEG